MCLEIMSESRLLIPSEFQSLILSNDDDVFTCYVHLLLWDLVSFSAHHCHEVVLFFSALLLFYNFDEQNEKSNMNE